MLGLGRIGVVLQGFQRQQHGAVKESICRLCLSLCAQQDPSLPQRRLALGESKRRQTERHNEASPKRGSERTGQPTTSPFKIGFAGLSGCLLSRLAPALNEASLKILPLLAREREPGFGRPLLVLRQPHATQQIAIVLVSFPPFFSNRREPPLQANVRSTLVEPAPQSLPLAQNGLMRQLDHRASSRRIMIDREQAAGGICVNDLLREIRRLSDRQKL